jgi:proteasome accessory factor B
MSKKNSKTQKSADRITSSQFRRLLRIHQLLANQKYPNTRSLAEKLEIHTRTVRRDIAFLRDSLNAPIKFDQKEKGFVYTHQNWEMPLVPLTEGELLAFFVMTIALQGMGSAYEDERLRKAISKIASSLPDEISVNLGYLFESTSFQAPPHVLVAGKLLDQLHQSIIEKEIVSFDYFTPGKDVTRNRRVEPLLLHNHEGSWYVIAFDYKHQKPITFHTGRIENLQSTGDYFRERKEFDKNEYLNESFGMYRGGKLTEVEINFDKHQSQWIRERNKYQMQETREELSNGGMKLKFVIGENGLEAVSRFCLQYAGHCQVMKPKKLIEIIKEKLQKGLDLHK